MLIRSSFLRLGHLCIHYKMDLQLLLFFAPVRLNLAQLYLCTG